MATAPTLAVQLAELAKQRHELIEAALAAATEKENEAAAIRAQLAQFGDGSGSGVAGSAPQTGLIATRNSWVPQVPPGIAAAAPTTAAPITAAPTAKQTTTAPTTAAPVSEQAKLNTDYLKMFKKLQVPVFEVTVDPKTKLVTVTFGFGSQFVHDDSMWARMGIHPNKTKNGNGFVYSFTMSTDTAARRYGDTADKIKTAFLAHLVLVFSRTARNGNKQTFSVTAEFMTQHAPNLNLTENEEKFCTSQYMMEGTYKFMLELAAKLSGKTVNQQQYSTRGSGGGGSVKQGLAAVTGAEFTPTGPLQARIAACYPSIVGAPPTNPDAYKRLQLVLLENNLAYSKASGSISSSDPNVTADEIEKILCRVFKLQTTAQIADSKRASAAEAYKKQQEEARAAQNASIGTRITGAAEYEEESEEESKPVTVAADSKPVTGADVRLVTDADKHCPNVGEDAKSEEEENTVCYQFSRNISKLCKIIGNDNAATICADVAIECGVVIENNSFRFSDGRVITHVVKNEVFKKLAAAAAETIVKYFD